MRISFCLGLLAFIGFVAPALAANSCYAPEQMRAEDLLRLHSELMVITVTCRQGSAGQDLPAAYGDFTKKNIGVLHDAEQTLISYYATHSKGDAVASLDRLRTILGNEFGQKAAVMTAPAYCAAFRDKVLDFDAAPPQAIKDEVSRLVQAGVSSVRPCADKLKSVVKKRG